MQFVSPEKRRVTATQAVEILAKHGTKISLEEAEIILDFMYIMSKLTVKTLVKTNKPMASSQSKLK